MLWILVLKAIFWLIVLSIASELLAQGAEVLEHKFGSGFVGAVILGFITMLPELIFVLIAVKANEIEVALGSAIGGNILLFTIGYGLVIIIAYFYHKTFISLPETIKDDLWYLLISAIILLVISLDGEFQWYEGAILTATYFVFVIHQLWETKHIQAEKRKVQKEKKLSEVKSIQEKTREEITASIEKTEEVKQEEENNRKGEGKEESKTSKDEAEEISWREWMRSIVFLLLGAAGLIIAAEPFVHVLVELSLELHVSALILALIISPLASELPEKISAFVLTKRSLQGAEMAIANFVGSKVQANTLLFGLMILYASYLEYPILTHGTFVEILLAVITTIVGVKFTYDMKLNKTEGLWTLGLYFISLGILMAFG